jgi:excisionase family DNA binding protein
VLGRERDGERCNAGNREDQNSPALDGRIPETDIDAPAGASNSDPSNALCGSTDGPYQTAWKLVRASDEGVGPLFDPGVPNGLLLETLRPNQSAEKGAGILQNCGVCVWFAHDRYKLIPFDSFASMPDEISVSETASLLGTSGQTVRNYIRRGLLSARRPGARSFLVDRTSVEALLRQGGPGRRRHRRTVATTLSKDTQKLAHERDELRVRIVELQEAVLRLRTAADLQRQADATRATEIERLLEALRAAELTDELRRRASAELEEALAGIALPGHPGDIAER